MFDIVNQDVLALSSSHNILSARSELHALDKTAVGVIVHRNFRICFPTALQVVLTVNNCNDI
jgi:hypothetical protein